jgi:hypothetical protein
MGTEESKSIRFLCVSLCVLCGESQVLQKKRARRKRYNRSLSERHFHLYSKYQF